MLELKISPDSPGIITQTFKKINDLGMKLNKSGKNDYNIVNNRRGYENKLNKLLRCYDLLNKNAYSLLIH